MRTGATQKSNLTHTVNAERTEINKASDGTCESTQVRVADCGTCVCWLVLRSRATSSLLSSANGRHVAASKSKMVGKTQTALVSFPYRHG